MTPKLTYHGPALFSFGFRPFFLSAVLFALVAIPLWWAVWRGDVGLASAFAPSDWHSHEMVFGYGAAVVAGFLFTAVPNWTGRMPTRGWPLMVLLAIWVAGRVAMAGLTGLSALWVLAVDQLFLLAVAAMIAREIVAGRNWRNLKVLVPVTLLWLSNVLFHVEAMTHGVADYGRRGGIALLVFLIMLIGGRIVPSFTRNWLAARRSSWLPVPFNRLDMVAIAVGAVTLVLWVVVPESLACGMLGAVAAVLHLVRLLRWKGIATFGMSLLLMLHIAYFFVPLGFAGVALVAFGLAGPAFGVHLFGIGAVGGMTVAVMMRATMGHTGRELEAGPLLTLAFNLVLGAALLRLGGGRMVLPGMDGVTLSALAWTFAFALLAIRLGPWLARPKVAARRPSGRRVT
ncbi:NnrS family protein [Pseudooceanicola sp.]|uniref:NnrS family protein n=1 Tax=Pseudooceanicola sp. TaxID=1914328 RepID=UPI0035C76959